MLIKCPECGKEVSDKANACPHCGNPMAYLGRIPSSYNLRENKSPNATMPVGEECKPNFTLDNQQKVLRWHNYCRVPLTVLIPSVLMMIWSLVLIVCTITYADDYFRGEEQGLEIVAICFACVPLAVGIDLIRGKSRARTLVSIFMIPWLCLSAVKNFCTLIIILPICVLWFFSLFSTSASRWFVAHKRLARRKKMKRHK